MENKAKFFIQWLGGKTKLIKEIEKYLPTDLNKKNYTYVEPFVGGGSMLFYLLQKYPNINRAIINDLNSDVINCYKAVKEKPFLLLFYLETIKYEISLLNKEDLEKYYYQKRDIFNKREVDSIESAAIFIFLNHFCYGGVYRVNKKGEFNVGFNHNKKSTSFLFDRDVILEDSLLLKRVKILNSDFYKTLRYANEDSFYFLDPPYHRKFSEKVNYYTKKGFNDLDQFRVKKFLEVLNSKKAKFILTNSNTDFIYELYKNYDIIELKEATNLTFRKSKQQKVISILVKNY